MINLDEIKRSIQSLAMLEEDERIAAINEIMDELKKIHPIPEPISFVKWVKQENVEANDYNPNSVAPPEMKLLHLSIKEDGYTQPIVTYKDNDKNVIVDGFHRNRVGREYKDINKRIKGYLPVVEINKPLEGRIASTIRHNRARGKHAIQSMSDIVRMVLERGWTDEEAARNLGMDADEFLRLKQNTGLPELFKNREFSKAWE